jgi:hypothetical protein
MEAGATAIIRLLKTSEQFGSRTNPGGRRGARLEDLSQSEGRRNSVLAAAWNLILHFHRERALQSPQSDDFLCRVEIGPRPAVDPDPLDRCRSRVAETELNEFGRPPRRHLHGRRDLPGVGVCLLELNLTSNIGTFYYPQRWDGRKRPYEGSSNRREGRRDFCQY